MSDKKKEAQQEEQLQEKENIQKELDMMQNVNGRRKNKSWP